MRGGFRAPIAPLAIRRGPAHFPQAKRSGRVMHINLNWFLGVLTIELWIAPYLLLYGPDILSAWLRSRDERRIRRYVRAYQRRQSRVARFRFAA